MISADRLADLLPLWCRRRTGNRGGFGMSLLIFLPFLLQDSPSQDGAGNSHRRRGGTAGKESNRDQRSKLFHHGTLRIN